MPSAAVITSIYFVLFCARHSADVPVSPHGSSQISREEAEGEGLVSCYGWTACSRARQVANAPQCGLYFIILFLTPKISKRRLAERKSPAK